MVAACGGLANHRIVETLNKNADEECRTGPEGMGKSPRARNLFRARGARPCHHDSVKCKLSRGIF